MDLLNLNTEQLASQRPTRSYEDENVLDLNPKKGQNGVYKLVGRLLPYWADPNLTKFTISKVLFTNPLTREKMMVDCPSSINKASILLTLDIMLRQREKQKMDEEVTKEIRKYFNRFTTFYSPMYVYQDPQVAVNNKKIKFFNFGIQFDKMIQEELKEDKLINKAKVNPYDLLNGKDVLISVKFKTKEYRTYEGSKFLPEITPFKFHKEDGTIHQVTLEELQQLQQGMETPLSALLKTLTPSLEPYKFKPWTDKTFTDTAVMLKAIVGRYGDLMQELLDSAKDQKMVEVLSGMLSKTAVSFAGATPQNVAENLGNAVAAMQQAPINTMQFATELPNATISPAGAMPSVHEAMVAPAPVTPPVVAQAPVAAPAPVAPPVVAQAPVAAPVAPPVVAPQTAAPAVAQAPATAPAGDIPAMQFFSEPDEFQKLLNNL